MYIFFYGLVYWSVERFKMLEMYDLHEDEAGGAMTSFFSLKLLIYKLHHRG